MKRTKIIMGMPVTVEIADHAAEGDLEKIFDYFRRVDSRYSPYKKTSELTKINEGLPPAEWSAEMKSVLELCEQTKQQTNGYFDIEHDGRRDPSGLVKGWAINNAARQLQDAGFTNFYIEAGGDVQAHGRTADGAPWKIGIRNPFNPEEIVKVVQIDGQGVATSGTYIRGEHIYNPHEQYREASSVKSLTVIGPDIYEADRFATAAFAMGPAGIGFIDALPGFEGYMIDDKKTATYTRGFEAHVVTPA